MATKTITTTITVHEPHAIFVPFEWDSLGAVTKGKYEVVAHPPGTPVTLDAEEADRILARFGGKELTPAELGYAALIADETAPPVQSGPPSSTSDAELAAAAAKAKK